MTLPRSGFKTGGGGGGGAASANAVESAAVIDDNAVVRGDGGVRGVQDSGVLIDDTDNVTGVATLTLPNTGLHLLDTNASHDLIVAPGSDLTADHTLTIVTGDADRTLTLAGAATISGTNTGDVTLAGTPDYITLAGQVLTRAKLDPADDLNTFASSVLAALVTDETGSDKLVFNTDPLFASTVTIPNVGLHLLDTNASHDLIVKPGSDLTADHTLTVTTGDADRTLTLTGDASLSGNEVTAAAVVADNAMVRGDGGARGVQGSDVLLTDNETIQFPSDGLLKWSDSTTPGAGTVTGSFGHDSGFFRFKNPNDVASGQLAIYLYPGVSRQFVYAVGALVLNSDTNAIRFTTSGGPDGPEISVLANSGGRLRDSSATSQPAYLLTKVLVEANTAGSGAPNVLTAAESGTVLTNEGTTAKNYEELPTAVSGLRFTLIVQDADGMRVVCKSGDTIRLAGSVSATGGYAESTTIGDMIDGYCINATEWMCHFTGAGWAVV